MGLVVQASSGMQQLQNNNESTEVQTLGVIRVQL